MVKPSRGPDTMTHTQQKKILREMFEFQIKIQAKTVNIYQLFCDGNSVSKGDLQTLLNLCDNLQGLAKRLVT